MLDILACSFSLEHEFYSDIKNINLFSIIDELSLLAQHYPLNRDRDCRRIPENLNSNICLNLAFFANVMKYYKSIMHYFYTDTKFISFGQILDEIMMQNHHYLS